MKKRLFSRTLDNAPMFSRTFDGAMSFLIGQLEFLDPIVHDPLHAETYAKYIPIKTGAGWVDSTSFINQKPVGVNQQPSSGRSNVIKRISADLTKTPTAVYTYKAGIEYSLEDLYKAAKAGYNIDDIYTRNLRLDYEKVVDRIAWIGYSPLAIPGLVGGRTGVSTYNVVNNAGGTSRLWVNKTADEILTDLNTLVYTFRSNCGFASYPNMIALPEAQFNYIASQKVNSLGNRSILDYFLENNTAKKAGVDLKVVPVKWLTPQILEGVTVGGGTGNAVDRMVAYVNDIAHTRFHLPVPLTREDVTKVDLGISVPYQGQIGGVEIIHTEEVLYAEGL